MKPNTSDHFNYRPWLAVAVSAAFFVPLLVLGGPALAKSASSASEYGGSSQYQYKVTLCHHTHSKKHPWVQISVGAPAVKAHLKHHDLLGPCPPASTTAGTTSHGKSGDKGKSGHQNTSGNQNKGKSGDDHGNSGSHGKGK
jgi:hypothetical protein